MNKYEEKKFNIPSIEGISEKTIAEHLKLYAGYVKNTNLIQEKINEYKTDTEKNMYVLGELHRRFSFEFNGMRNHEYYFEQIEGGRKTADMDSSLNKKMIEDFGSVDNWFTEFVNLCMTRGIGWAVLWYDRQADKLINSWVDEQHLGHLNSLTFIYGVDMWEHSYLMDYTPSEKRKYIDAYTQATNQDISVKRFEEALKS